MPSCTRYFIRSDAKEQKNVQFHTLLSACDRVELATSDATVKIVATLIIMYFQLLSMLGGGKFMLPADTAGKPARIAKSFFKLTGRLSLADCGSTAAQRG